MKCVYASRKLRTVEDRRDEWVDGKEKEFMVLMGGRDITGYVSLQKLFRAEEKQQTQTQQ